MTWRFAAFQAFTRWHPFETAALARSHNKLQSPTAVVTSELYRATGLTGPLGTDRTSVRSMEGSNEARHVWEPETEGLFDDATPEEWCLQPTFASFAEVPGPFGTAQYTSCCEIVQTVDQVTYQDVNQDVLDDCAHGGELPCSDQSEDAMVCFERAMADLDKSSILGELVSRPFPPGCDPFPTPDA